MRLNVDDWQFLAPTTPGTVLAANLFLDNGQQARLEVSPLFYADPTGEQIPEIVVYCEMPGERLHRHSEVKRWLSRPPDKSCAWSQIELSPAFVRQINEMLDQTVEAPASVGA